MPDWMAASDVLVHSTCGLTVLESLMRGCPAVSYGWGRGHIRRNDEALRRFGLADVVANRRELRPTLERAIARRRRPDPRFADLPSAASFVLALADRTSATGQPERAPRRRVVRRSGGRVVLARSAAAQAGPRRAPRNPLPPGRARAASGSRSTTGRTRRGRPPTLDALSAAGATATFFLVGEQVARWPGLAAEIAAAGHEIGLHGYRHRLLLRRSVRRARERPRSRVRGDRRSDRARAACYRPPYGIFCGGALASRPATRAGRLCCGRVGCGLARSRDPGHRRAARDARPCGRRCRAAPRRGSLQLRRIPGGGRSRALPAIVAAVEAIGEPFVPATNWT